MPPKEKKKGSHVSPEIHPHILKRREAERIKAEKKFARGLKKLKKNRKRTNTATLSSTNFETSCTETLHYDTSGEENEIQRNVDLQHFSCSEPSTSHAGRQQVKHETVSTEISEEFKKDCTKVQEKSLIKSLHDVPQIPENVPGRKHFRTNVAEISQGSSKSVPKDFLGGKKFPKDPVQIQGTIRDKESVGKTTVKVASKYQQPIQSAVSASATTSCSEPSTSHSGGQRVKHETASTRIGKKIGKDCTTAQEKLLIKSQYHDPQIPENVTGSKHFRRNVAEIGQGSSKSDQKAFLGDKKLLKDPVQIQGRIRGKESVGKTRAKLVSKPQEPIRSVEGASASSKKVLPKERKKCLEDLLKKKEELQLKHQIYESEMKCLDDQKKILPPINLIESEQPGMAVIGDIKVRISDKSGRKTAEKGETFSYSNAEKRVLRIGDEHVEISIFVYQGSQVICKSKRRQIVDSDNSNVELGSQRPECQTMINVDKSTISDSEWSLKSHDKSTNDTKCTSSSIRDVLNKEQTLEEQATICSDGDIIPEFEQPVETITATKSTSNSITEYLRKEYQTFDDKATICSDVNIVPDSGQKVETMTDTKCASSSISEYLNKECQTLKDQATVCSDRDIIPHTDEQVEMITDGKYTATSVNKQSEENSGLTSVQENVKKFCDNFLKDFIVACEHFEARAMRCIKDDKNLKK